VAPRATPPVLLWDDAYESAAPRWRLVRRLALGAALVILLAGGTAFGIWLAGPRGTGPQQPVVNADPFPPGGLPTASDSTAITVAATDSVATPPAPPRLAPRQLPPRPRPRLAPVAPGRLFVGATPWGELYIDDSLVGHTPKVALPLAAGWHQVRVVRDGFARFEQRIRVAPGEDVRLTGIVLQNVAP
jgi:hypothetical protein